jgi:quinol-cytochrome oxidoreductase complex cytochrome b subunit
MINYLLLLVLSIALNLLAIASLYLHLAKRKHQKRHNAYLHDLARLSTINLTAFITMVFSLNLNPAKGIALAGLIIPLILLSLYDIIDHRLSQSSRTHKTIITSLYLLANALIITTIISMGFPQLGNIMTKITILIILLLIPIILLGTRKTPNPNQ